jgi:hypothetical protein
MTYDKSTLTVEPTSRDRVLTPAFLLVAAATLFAFLSIGVVLPVLPRYTEGPLGTGSVGVGLAVGAASLTALLAQPPAGRLGDLDSFLDAAGISEARADRYMGHAQNTIGDRYRHRLRGQLAEDARRLEEYLKGDAAEVVPLPTGAQTGAQTAEAASLSGTG